MASTITITNALAEHINAREITFPKKQNLSFYDKPNRSNELSLRSNFIERCFPYLERWGKSSYGKYAKSAEEFNNKMTPYPKSVHFWIKNRF